MSEEKITAPGEEPDTATGQPYRASDVQMPQGPEPPPKGVRAMAVVRWMLLLAMTALAAYSVWTYWGPGSRAHVDHRANLYYCPMHPQIRSPDPGECPICHMNLELIPEDRRQSTGPMGAAITDAGPRLPGNGSPPQGPTPASPSDAGSGASGDQDASATAPPGVVPVTLSLERQQLIGMTTTAVQRRALGQQLRVPGVVEVPENAVAQVHVRASGYIERVAVRENGVRVASGQPLAWFYSPQIYQAQQELLTTQRWAGDHADGGSAASPVDAFGAARRNLQLLGLADADIDEVLRRATALRAVPIRAPIAGYVTRYAAVLGQYVEPAMTLYELSDLSRVWIVASLYERDLSRVRRGMSAQFSTPASQGAPLAARVELVEPSVAAESRTARVRLSVANPELRLRPGQYGDVTFALPGTASLVVGRDAVIDTGTAQYAFVDEGGGRFEPRRVRTGALVGGELEVLEGLREGERVVARGNFMVDSESRLQAALAEVPAPPPPPAPTAEVRP